MTRIIREQVITTSGPDLDGPGFTRDEIRYIFEKMPESAPLIARHDMTTEPIARSYNKRLKELSNGELAVTVDIEVFNEAAFGQFGGMSIGLVRSVMVVGNGPGEGAITVNTKQFDAAWLAKELDAELGSKYRVEVVERVEKTAELTAAIVVVAGFVGLKILESFIGGVGADLYAFVKSRLRRRDDPAAPIQVHIHLHLHHEEKTPVVVLNVAPDVTADQLRALNADAIREAIARAGGESNVQRVVASIAPDNVIDVAYLVDAQGRPIRRDPAAELDVRKGETT
jgi:hypothetical protein